MADTQLHYVDYDPDKTWRMMMETYIAEGGDILYPGDEKEILLRGMLAALTAVAAKLDNGLKMDTLAYSVREYLKMYGARRKCYYVEAAAATCQVQITFAASGVAQEIPAGTELTADGTVMYALTEPLQQTGTAQTAVVTVKCTQAGLVGNGLYAGAQLQFLQTNDAVRSVYAVTDATGGADAEDEETYRERIRVHGLSTVTTGPASMYEALAMAAGGDSLLDVKALNDGAAEVGVYLILAEDADQETVFSTIEQALTPRDSRPLTDNVTLHAASEVAYTLDVSVWPGDALTSDIEQVIEVYRTWQEDTLGRAFNPDWLIARLYQAGCTRVKYADGSGIDGSVEYAEIDPRERCKGVINLTVVSE